MNAKIKKFGFPLPIAGASGGSKSPSVPREDPDNLQSSAYVNIIDLIGEGQIGGLVDNVDGDSLTEKEKSIFFDGTRLRHTNGELNFANVSWAERVGLQRQDYIEGFGEGVETPFYKNVQLKSGIPSAFTVSNPNADRVRIILAVNSLLSTDRSSGDTYGTSVEFQIKLSVNNGPYEILANKKITGKTTSRYQRSFSFDLPKKKADGTPITAWSFQITRTTPDSNSSYLQNTTFFESYSEVELTKFSYPNVALVATRFSSETFSSIPKREYLVDGLLIKVPSNRNKDGSYTGPWDGTFKLESSSNPAWILYDLLLSKRYGLGEYITPEMIDESRLYVIGQYCDQLVDDGFGNKEPRYTINCVINTRVEAYDLIVDICSAFNGMAYWAGHMVGFTIDAPGTPQMLFNNTNIVGDFSYQGTSNKDRHSVAVVTWNDPNDDYKQVPEVVEDPELIERYGIRKTEVMAFGCTSRGQAARYGRWLLYSEHQQSETITFNVGIDAALLLPGDLIYVQDRDRAGKRFGGRLLDCTAKQAVLDDLVEFGQFTDLTLVIRLEDGSLAERVIASHTKKTVTVSGHTKEVTVVEWAEALTVMPVKYALWIIKAAELQPVIARVVNVAQGEEKGTYNITAVPHNPNKYQSIENDLMLDVPPTSILNSRNQEPPASVEIKSEIITTQNVAKTRLVISWKEAKNAARYEVEWKRNDGNWVKLPQTTSLSIEVEDVYAGAYTARVVAYNLFGARSYPKYSTSTDVKGKVGKPTNVLSLTTTPLLFGMKLDWVYPAGNSDLSHVVIEVSDRADGSNPRLLGNVSYPTNTLTIQGLQGGLDQWYRTKTVDKSGNESDWSNFVKGTTGNDPDQVLDLISGQIGESDLATELQGKIENSVNVSEAAKIVADNAQTAATNAQTAATDAKTAASEAQKAASSAQTQASSAQQTASEASTTAANAKNAADQAVTAANQAKTAADNAATTAATASSTASKAQTTANDAAAAASKVASDLTTSTNQLNKKIADETDARTAAISKLNDGLTIETSQRKTEDAALLSNIETYKSSTNGTLSSLQTQINTNATNTSANTSKISSLDSRLTTNEGKTADAINAAATAQQTANTAVTNAAAAASAVTSLKSELSTGKGINNIIAPFSDPQELSPYIIGASRTVALVKSPMRIKGNAYDVTFNAVAGSIYFGSSSLATVNTAAAGVVSGGKRYMLSAYLKNLDATKQADVYFTLHWFKRAADGTFTASQSVLLNQATNNTRVTPSNDGGTISCKAVAAPPDAVAFAVICSGNGVYNVAGSRILIDMLMLEEVVGVDVPASTWTAGPTDLSAIKSALDANASAISKIDTRVTNAEGTITSQGNSITQLNNSVTSINGELTKKADATALNALTNRVSTAEGTITSQGNSITSLRNDLNATNDKVSSKADSSALNSLDSKVTSIDGRVTSNTSAVTSLQGRVSTVEGGLSSKADASALNNYYTKTEADSAASGAIDKFNSQLTIGGVNAVANSEAPRTSTAATNKEYLLYERSAELKTFYDENLEKPITISFEMSVPVAGPVQVYSSNGSAHQFVTSVNAVIVNQFAKYSVTVSPKSHTASTTVSTIEFYGTYGTGRIPTIRKLQIEAGTKATAWSPSPRDTKAAIDANASAIQTTQTKVDNIDGRLTTATDSITSLNSRMSTAEGNINSTNTAVGGLSTRMATAEGKITNQSDSIASLQNSVTSINGTLANKADSSAVNNLTSRVETAEGKISSQSGQITSLSNSLDLTNSNLNDVNVLARLLSLGKPLREDPTFKTTSSGGLSAYNFPAGTSWIKQAKSTDNPTGSTYEMLIKATQALGGGWYPTAPTLVLTANKTFLIKQIIKMPVGTRLLPVGNTTGTGGYIRILGNDLGTGKFETYYSVVQGGSDLSSSIQGHFRVIAGTNPPVPTVDSPVFVILASYEVFDVTAVNDTIPKAYSDAIAANANAINTISNAVSQQGNTIASHSNSITQLNNSITSINGALSNKADASALQSLDSKVTLIDGKVTSNSSALTALQSSFEGIPNQGVNLLGPEISNPIEKPNWISGLPFEVIQSPDTVNVRAFQFTMTANTTSGTYFNIGGGQVPRQWLTEGKYIFSFVAKTVDGAPPHPIDWVMYNVSTARQRFNITATLTRYSAVFTVPAGGAAACMLLYGNPAGKPAGQVINIERMMLERQVGNNTTPSTWIAGSDPTGMIISTQAKATDLFNTASNQNNATAGRVTSLESRMTTTEGNLSKKADASALQNLDTKVTNVDGKVTSNTNAITSLNSALSNATSSISMNAGNAQGDWTFFNTSGEYSIVAQADGQAGRVIQLGNNAGNDIVWMHPNNFIPFDATKTYRLRVRYRRRAGNGTIYVGVSQKTPDKALYVTTTNALSGDMGSSNYVVNAHAPAIDEWQEIVAYIKGRSAGAASGSGSKTSPRTVSQQAGFITPMFIANYSAQTGIVELDYLILEDAEAIVGNDANASAISALDTKVSEVDGRLTTATNSITSLNSRMSAAEGNISAANSALSGLSTRMTAAENGLTNQSNAITNLSNSLTVTTNTANAALPKIQGGTGAAKLFRGVLVWQQNGANLTGNIVIQTPITFTNKMFRLSLTGYNYLAAKNEINLNIGGYAYSGTSLLQHGVVNSGTMPIRVRMGVRNGTVVVILTSQAPGAYWQYPKFSIDAEIGYTTPPDSWADGWSASFMAEADLASNGISAIIEPSLLDISTTLNATASAISNLTNIVSQQGDTITSQSNSITTLTNKITNNDLSNLVLNPDFVDPKSDWTSGVIVDATDAAPNPPSPKALRLNNRDSYYGPFVKCNVGDMFYVSAWFATPNTSVIASAVLGFNTRNSAGTYTWYSVAVKSTDKNAWGMVEGYFTVPNGMVEIRPWLQVSIAASEAAGQQWHVTNIQVRNITGNKKLATDLQATSSALSTLDSKVTNIDGRVTSASNNIVSLNNSVTNINATLAQKADATALNSLSNRVTNAEGNITSQGNSITSLTNSLAVSGKGGTNLLIKSNVVGLYDGVSYPHHTYKLGEDWEIGAKYTLIWCAEHKRGTGDNNSYLAVYAGGGSQTLQSIVNTDGKVISKVTFVKNSAVASGPIIHFYMINRPTADKGTIGTVYWAVLVKGDVLTTDAWIPSPYDYIPDSNANASAIANLANTVSQQGNTITSNSSSITSLTNQIGNTKSYSLVTFRNGSAVGMPKAAGVYTGNNTRLYGFGRGLNLIVFKNGDVESCTQYDTYGDIVSACNAIYAAIKALASGTYFAIVGTDNIGSVGNSNPNTDLRALLLACGAGDTYFRSWNWNALPIFVGRKDLDAGNGILGMFDSTVPNQWIEYPLTFVNGVPVGLGDSRTLTTQLDANASAISSLSNTVTQQGKDIASHSSSITSLNNSITNINGTLATKADSSALTNLANRVTTTEGAITSQGSSITSLNASVNGLLKDVAVSDTRSTNQPPSWYWSNYPLRIVREFKQASVLGLTGMGTYVSLETYVYWTDASGGPIIQIARGTDSKLTAERRSTSTSTWGSWSQDIKTLTDGLANKAEASALSSLDAKVSTIDGKVSTQATSITNLQTTVGGHTASIQSQQQSIDGLKSRATLKLQSGNLIGGVGIENDSKTVDFIIQANKFAIAPPSDAAAGSVAPKYAFVYQPTATTLPNGTVVPAGLYLDNASIGYINAEKINASSLSAISANLGTLTTLKDPTKPNGARMVITGSLTTVYDDNNVARIRLGIW
ncbi:TPA: phage tail protein [Acinetobacter baumannii]|uniref:TipJ family phage tail tip protein n=1 Tax=Acinetobacter baumannii TaxID=470 RepID=UPI00338F940A